MFILCTKEVKYKTSLPQCCGKVAMERISILHNSTNKGTFGTYYYHTLDMFGYKYSEQPLLDLTPTLRPVICGQCQNAFNHNH